MQYDVWEEPRRLPDERRRYSWLAEFAIGVLKAGATLAVLMALAVMLLPSPS